jgi:hypothetical protein
MQFEVYHSLTEFIGNAPDSTEQLQMLPHSQELQQPVELRTVPDEFVGFILLKGQIKAVYVTAST